MPKLEKFKSNENKPSIKYTICAFVIIFILIVIFIIYKSHALYKIEESHDIIKAKIRQFDIEKNIDFTLNGEKIDAEFPNKESGYTVLSVTCDNGVTASWDIESWQLTDIANATRKISCTVNFEYAGE